MRFRNFHSNFVSCGNCQGIVQATETPFLAAFIYSRDRLHSENKKDGERAVYGGEEILQRESRDANVRKIEYMIRHEKEIAEAVEEAKLSPSSNLSGEHTGHSYIPDPTASQAIRHAAEVPKVFVDGRPVEWPERWLQVVRAVRAWCREDSIRGEIFRRRYGGHRKESRFLTMDSLHIAERTYYSVLDDIRAYAIQCAAQAQVVRVF